MALITIDLAPPSEIQARAWCQRLEAGDILYFPQTPIQIRPEDLSFLLGQQQTGSTLAQEHRLQAESGQRERP